MEKVRNLGARAAITGAPFLHAIIEAPTDDPAAEGFYLASAPLRHRRRRWPARKDVKHLRLAKSHFGISHHNRTRFLEGFEFRTHLLARRGARFAIPEPLLDQ